ncbi:MAG: hypothetical protein ACLTSZ_19220 [Lachnospiraceae bacterium]
MQRESVNQKRGVSARNWIVWLAVLIAAPATLLVAWRFGNRKYYLSSLLLIVYAMLPFFVRFEHKKPQARELVTIAVMSAVAVASRAAFIMVPFFKPLTGIVMIAGMALGPEAGFLTGAISGFVSNHLPGGAVDAMADDSPLAWQVSLQVCSQRGGGLQRKSGFRQAFLAVLWCSF